MYFFTMYLLLLLHSHSKLLHANMFRSIDFYFFIIIIQMKSVHVFLCQSLDVCLSSPIFGLLFTVAGWFCTIKDRIWWCIVKPRQPSPASL